ncbi:MAG: hypothetical protein M1839_007353 [Geoglossum umbratile]|nr:MAG: hypothetical protein M1839_007353 [Geoglossum umbratile]
MPYDQYERQRHRGAGRGTFGYWIPLVVTVTAATFGLAAWIWSERRNNDDDDSSDESRDERREERKDDRKDASRSSHSDRQQNVEDDASGGMVARMSGALRRTPSPQQILDGASKRVAASVAAASTAVGGVLSSIREEEKDDYADHSRWSEEADGRRLTRETAPEQAPSQAAGPTTQSTSGVKGLDPTPTLPATTPITSTSTRNAVPSGYRQSAIRRKKVAIVVSAETNLGAQDEGEHGNHHEQASILSHLPSHIDLDVTELFVLIYAPEIKQHPLSISNAHRPVVSNTSSFSNIGHDEAYTPGEELEKPLVSLDPKPVASESSGMGTPRTPGMSVQGLPAFKNLYKQALSLVEKSTMVLPFTTPSGHVHIIRHLAPEVVYLQESLSGDNGDVVTQISSWVGQVVVVVGAEGGHGGLVDSEDEMHQEGKEKKTDKWWEQAERVGLGKGVEVVEGLHVGEHWGRRIAGKD